MLDSIKLRKSTFELYKKAIIEISESVNLLTSKNLNLSIIPFTRQLFEVARTLEILAENHKLTSAYHLEIRKIEFSKMQKSELDVEGKDEYILNSIEPNIKELNDLMSADNVKLKDFVKAKTLWNEQNKDVSFYNKISEGLHLDINFLIVHYLQNKDIAEKFNLQTDWDENKRLQLSKELFDHWLRRCDNAITSITNH